MAPFPTWLDSLFPKKTIDDPKNRVCWHFLAKMLGGMLFFNDEEEAELMKLDANDPDVLRELVREFIFLHYHFYPPENQKKIHDTLTYYLATDSPLLERVFPSRHINMDVSGKLFYTIVWQELYDTDGPDPVNPDNYIEDCSTAYINSLAWQRDLQGVVAQAYGKPCLARVLNRLEAIRNGQSVDDVAPYDRPLPQQDDNSTYTPHGLDRHGPETTRQQQLLRATKGLTPDGVQHVPVDASRWYRLIDVYDGWQAVIKTWERQNDQSGLTDNEMVVSFDKNIGEGYRKNTNELIKTNKAVYRFGEYGNLFTDYPLL